MEKFKTLKLLGLYVLGIAVLTVLTHGAYAIGRNWGLIGPPRSETTLKSTQAELINYKIAAKINDYYYRFNKPVRIKVVHQVLNSLDTYLPRYFPEGPYTKKDLLAIAMVESNFEQYLTGKKKEYGIFQIMPESSKWMGVAKNQFDVAVNTELALFVLQKKYEQHKDYKIGIIAYNGLVKRRGKLSEDYWERFIKYRRAIDDILREFTLEE